MYNGRGPFAPFFLIFNLSEDFLPIGKFLSKNSKFGAENLRFMMRKFNCKIEMVKTHNVLCLIFSTVCRKIATFYLFCFKPIALS